MYRIVFQKCVTDAARCPASLSMLEVDPISDPIVLFNQVLLHLDMGPGHLDPVCRLVQTIAAYTDLGPTPLIKPLHEDVSGVNPGCYARNPSKLTGGTITESSRYPSAPIELWLNKCMTVFCIIIYS